MWVKIVDVVDDKTLVGVLINEPINISPVKKDDLVYVDITTIKQIIYDKK